MGTNFNIDVIEVLILSQSVYNNNMYEWELYFKKLISNKICFFGINDLNFSLPSEQFSFFRLNREVWDLTKKNSS